MKKRHWDAQNKLPFMQELQSLAEKFGLELISSKSWAKGKSSYGFQIKDFEEEHYNIQD